jgi:hypothetical protein
MGARIGKDLGNKLCESMGAELGEVREYELK